LQQGEIENPPHRRMIPERRIVFSKLVEAAGVEPAFKTVLTSLQVSLPRPYTREIFLRILCPASRGIPYRGWTCQVKKRSALLRFKPFPKKRLPWLNRLRAAKPLVASRVAS